MMDAQLVKRLEQTVNRLENFLSNTDKKRLSRPIPPISTISNVSLGILPRNVSLYDDAIADPLKRWSEVSKKIGGEVEDISKKVTEVFAMFRDFLLFAAGTKRPSESEFKLLITPLYEKLQNITEYRESNRFSKYFNHFSCVEEAINGLGWITVNAAPASFVKEMFDASLFYSNRILVEHKASKNEHVEWSDTWKEVWNNMYSYVKNIHTTGLVWNSDPEVKLFDPKDEPPTSMAPPPPPPPIPSDLFKAVPSIVTNNYEKSKRDALFEQINQGSSVTAGLKKVTADMQTHKNTALRATTNGEVTVNGKHVSDHFGKVSTQNHTVKQQKPRIHLQDGKQWSIDYVRNDSNVNIDVDDKKQTIYIYKCENSVIKVNGKSNAITLDGCKKTSVVFDGVVSQIEVINSQGIQIQTFGELPTVSIQKTDGCQVYLSKASHNAQIVSSKSSEMNILAQLNDLDDEFTEMAIPEQFVTTLSGKKLQTIASDIV